MGFRYQHVNFGEEKEPSLNTLRSQLRANQRHSASMFTLSQCFRHILALDLNHAPNPVDKPEPDARSREEVGLARLRDCPSRALTLSHTSLSHTHSLAHTLSVSHTHSLSLTHSLSHTHTHSLSLTHTLSLSHTHTSREEVGLSANCSTFSGLVLPRHFYPLLPDEGAPSPPPGPASGPVRGLAVTRVAHGKTVSTDRLASASA